jgi:hypothetical protein
MGDLLQSPVQLWWTLPLNLSYVDSRASAQWGAHWNLIRADSCQILNTPNPTQPQKKVRHRFGVIWNMCAVIEFLLTKDLIHV